MNLYFKHLNGDHTITNDVRYNKIFYNHNKILRLQDKIYRVNFNIFRQIIGKSPELVEIKITDTDLI